MENGRWDFSEVCLDISHLFCHTCTPCISTQVDREEVCFTVQVEVIVRGISSDVIVGGQGYVKLEPSVLLVYYVKYLFQAQPVFTYTHTHTHEWKELISQV